MFGQEIPSADAERMARLSYAFSDPLRVLIVAILREQKSVCVCQFQSQLDLSQSKASYHLKVLINTGIIRREIRGTWSHYSLVDKNAVDCLWRILDVSTKIPDDMR